MQGFLQTFFSSLFLISFLFGGTARALPSTNVPKTTDALELKVLSYNVKGLPSPLVTDGGRLRFIGELLANLRRNNQGPQVVVLQEAFRESVKDLIKASGYPFVEIGPDAEAPGKWANSGLYVLSEFPISSVARVAFHPKSCAGWDCYANKGILKVEIKIPGLSTAVQILTTHMNSNGASGVDQSEVDKSKYLQINETKKFLDSHLDRSLPTVFAGDFNMNPRRVHWQYLNESLNLSNAGEICARKQKAASGETCLIDSSTDSSTLFEATPDHHYFQSGKAVSVIPIFAIKNMRETFNGKPMSDHLGYQVHYLLKW